MAKRETGIWRQRRALGGHHFDGGQRRKWQSESSANHHDELYDQWQGLVDWALLWFCLLQIARATMAFDIQLHLLCFKGMRRATRRFVLQNSCRRYLETL